MTSWADFQAEDPALAQIVRRTFGIRKHATMATVRRDGAPRISGTEVQFGEDGELYLGMMPGTRRAADLRRDPRVAIHCPTEDAPDADPAAWLGDGKIAGRAHEIEPDRFRIDIDQVVHTRVTADAQQLEITTWRSGSGTTRQRRG